MSQVIESSSVFHQAHLKRVHQEIAPRSFYSKASETFLFFLNAGSLTRNSMSAGGIWKGAEAAARVAPAVGGLVIAGGAMALIRGSEIVKAGLSGVRTAYERSNWEGGFLQSTTTAVGASYMIAGAGMITAQSAALASAATAAAAGTIIFTGGAFGLYGALSIYAGYGLAVNYQFRHNLNKVLKSPADEAEKMASAMQWIHDQVGSGKSEAELNKKWDQFAFRTSEACCRYARKRITPEFIEQVRSGDAKALGHAKWIIQEVKRANGKQIAINWLLMVISAIGLAGIVLGMLFASGPLAPLIFAICAGLWFLFDTSKLQEKFGNFFCGASEIPSPAMAPKAAPRAAM